MVCNNLAITPRCYPFFQSFLGDVIQTFSLAHRLSVGVNDCEESRYQ